jgi:hypothetical protein
MYLYLELGNNESYKYISFIEFHCEHQSEGLILYFCLVGYEKSDYIMESGNYYIRQPVLGGLVRLLKV